MLVYQPSPWFATASPAVPEWELVDDGLPLAVDLDTVKNFLNIPLEDTAFDAEKTAMAYTAQAEVETYISASLTAATWVANLPQFYDAIRIDKRPFQSVTKIEYVDPDTGVITTLASSTYVVGKLRQQCGLISRGDGQAWPQTARRWDAVRITIVAGYDPDALPYEIQQALLITTGAIDRTRGDGGSSGGGRLANTVWGQKHGQAASIMPMEAKALLRRHRMIRVGL